MRKLPFIATVAAVVLAVAAPWIASIGRAPVSAAAAGAGDGPATAVREQRAAVPSRADSWADRYPEFFAQQPDLDAANQQLTALVESGSRDTLDVLTAIVETRSLPRRWRNYAVQHLGHVARLGMDGDVLSPLRSYATPDAEPEVRDVAVYTIALIASTSGAGVAWRVAADRAVAGALAATDPLVIESGIRGSVLLGDSANLPVIARWAGDATQALFVRLAAVDAVGLLGSRAVVPFLISVLRDAPDADDAHPIHVASLRAISRLSSQTTPTSGAPKS
ncbi:MAG: hypothetical protein H0W72_02225 [Planctomycetes bacterium]|nr:hypothetical protein [Planctomycetota bacterium]